jgi:sodium/bile acid cotransporter 7
MRLKTLPLIGCAMLAVWAACGPARGQGTMTDAAKKAIVYGMYADYRREFPGVQEVAPAEAMRLLEKGRALFVDTRRPEEMAVSMLPGAVSQAQFLANPEPYRDRTVIVYCTISYRSGLLAARLADQGIPVSNLQGGLLAWVLEGGRVYDGAKETRRIHVYGPKWNYPPAGYTSVTFGLWDRLRH